MIQASFGHVVTWAILAYAYPSATRTLFGMLSMRFPLHAYRDQLAAPTKDNSTALSQHFAIGAEKQEGKPSTSTLRFKDARRGRVAIWPSGALHSIESNLRRLPDTIVNPCNRYTVQAKKRRYSGQ